VNLEPLCDVEFRLHPAAPLPLGRSPWRNRRVSYIEGGRFTGRLQGEVLPGGGDWSELGFDQGGTALTLLDVRSLWRTEDGADLYVTYAGRLVIPPEVLPEFRDPAALERLDPNRYYFRTAPLFETSDERYGWLNGIIALGTGRRTVNGVRYSLYEVK